MIVEANLTADAVYRNESRYFRSIAPQVFFLPKITKSAAPLLYLGLKGTKAGASCQMPVDLVLVYTYTHDTHYLRLYDDWFQGEVRWSGSLR